MYCKNCGGELADNARFCQKCGVLIENSLDNSPSTKETGGSSPLQSEGTSANLTPKTLFPEIIFFIGISVVFFNLIEGMLSGNNASFANGSLVWLVFSLIASGFIFHRYIVGYYKIYGKRHLLRPGLIFGCLLTVSLVSSSILINLNEKQLIQSGSEADDLPTSSSSMLTTDDIKQDLEAYRASKADTAPQQAPTISTKNLVQESADGLNCKTVAEEVARASNQARPGSLFYVSKSHFSTTYNKCFYELTITYPDDNDTVSTEIHVAPDDDWIAQCTSGIYPSPQLFCTLHNTYYPNSSGSATEELYNQIKQQYLSN